MSNYLNHLINRGLDRTNQVKPRLPSLFEPLPETAGLTAGLRAAFTGNDLVTTPVLETIEWETHPQRPGIQKAESSVSSLDSPATAFSESRSPSTEQELSPSLQPPLKLPTLPNEHRPAISSSASRAEGQPELLSQTLSPPHVPILQTPPLLMVIDQWSESIVPISQAVTLPVHQPDQPEITAEPFGQKHLPITSLIDPAPLSSSPASIVQETPAIRPASVVSPAIERIAPQVQFLEGQPIAPSQPVPTIHVTIGRIEVRAFLPASVQPKSRPAPAMNLDDYLRQRGGGK